MTEAIIVGALIGSMLGAGLRAALSPQEQTIYTFAPSAEVEQVQAGEPAGKLGGAHD